MTMGAQFVTNRVEGQVRRAWYEAREYLVAPVVAIRAGVLNGELVTQEEIGRVVEAWNGIPLPLGHPTERGVYVSANTPEVLERCVGRFFHAQMAGDRLLGELWLDVEKAQALGGDALEALQRIERGDPVEVSTAYFRDVEAGGGTLNGARYETIARNLRPDHLAILVHGVGACSWRDGCGAPRVNRFDGGGEKEDVQVTNQQRNGVMVALYPAEADAEALLAVDGLPEGAEATAAGELHLTLAYLGEVGQVGISQGELLERVMSFANESTIVRGFVGGVGRFNSTDEDGRQPFVALFDCDYLYGWRHWLVEYRLPAAPYSGHGFIPHLTLAYVPAGAPTPGWTPARRELVFDRIGVAWGGQVTMFKLQGEAQAAEAAAVGANQARFDHFRGAFGQLMRSLAGVDQALKFYEEEVGVNKQELVEKLAANQGHPFSREELGGMPESALAKLEQKLAEGGGCGGGPAVNAGQANGGLNGAPAEMRALSADVQAALVEMRTLSAGVNAALAELHANQAQEQAGLVTELLANERCAFGEEELKAMSLTQLGKLADSLRPVSYAGRGGPRGGNKPAVPEAPAVILAKEA